MSKNHLRIATRKSPLALWQAQFIKKQLQILYPELNIELVKIMTQADKFIHTPLSQMGGKGLFVKELEDALLKQHADIAVHSIKDLPSELPAELELAVFCKRDDPRDALISQKFLALKNLPSQAKVGTSSLRRQCQIAAIRPDLKLENLRGNVDTRLTKLKENHYDAIVLAVAGLKRLQLEQAISEYFPTHDILPAIGQGAIGIECRKDDNDTFNIIKKLDDLTTRQCITAERAMNKEFGGNCQTPVAGYATIINNQLILQGLVGKADGSLILRATKTGVPHDAEIIGNHVAQALFTQGAEEILKLC